uniref:Uncharacterized protein n=1 Tax=Prymnesium polylepis TaxID=72548 RepID=A0A7S4INI4_9EUKA
MRTQMGEPVPADAMTLALCKLGDVAAVQAYLKKNPGMLNSKSEKKGLLPLQVAAGFEQPEVVKALLELNANLLALDNYAMTPMHVAASKENIECLTIMLADPKGKEAANTADEDGSTPLHHAAYSGLKANVEALMAAGAVDNGKTAAMEATEKGFDECAAAIAAGAAAAAPAEGGEAAEGEEGEAE